MLTLSKSKNGVLVEGFPTEAEMQAFFDNDSLWSYYLGYSDAGEGTISKRCLSNGTCTAAAKRYYKPDTYSMSKMVYGNVANPGLEALVLQIQLDPEAIQALALPFDVLLKVKVHLRKSLSTAIDEMELQKNCSAFFAGWGVWEYGEAPPTIGSMGIWNLTPMDTYNLEAWNYGRSYNYQTMLSNFSSMGSVLAFDAVPSKALRWLRGFYNDEYFYHEANQYQYKIACNEVVPTFYQDVLFNEEVHYPGLPLNYSIGNVADYDFETGQTIDGFANYLKFHSMTSLAGWRWPVIEIGIPNGYSMSLSDSVIGPTIEAIELVFQEETESLFWTGNKGCIEFL